MALPNPHQAANENRPAPHAPNASPLALPARLGRAMKKHPQIIAAIQWSMVILYLWLLLAPAVLFPEETGSLSRSNLQVLSIFAFWGLGWPLIILSCILFGRFWCGVFCPEGALTETFSRYGQHRFIPRWIRWPQWPVLTWLLYTLSLFLSGATRSYGATVTLLGAVTLAALLTGFLYGNGRRIWCMYLCPASIALSFSARLSLFHFRVDRQKWETSPNATEHPVCAPLIPIKQMKSASACHACGRCSGYREAVDLAVRAPGAEILSDPLPAVTATQALTLLFGMMGLSFAAFFLDRLQESHLPIAGLPARLGLLAAVALLSGAFAWSFIRLACRIPACRALSWQQLSLGLIPLAGVSLFLTPASQALAFAFPAVWNSEKLALLRLPFLAAALCCSLWLGWRLIRRGNKQRPCLAMLLYSVAPCEFAALWAAAGFYL